MKVLVLNTSEVEACLDRDALRDAMESALKALSSKDAQVYPRLVFPFRNVGGMGFMPALNNANGLLGYKAVSVFHGNAAKGINPHQGIVALLDEDTGQLKGMMEGSTVTALRTAAASAVATKHLSREDSRSLGILGAGREGYEHALAIARVRPIKEVTIFNRSRERAVQLAETLRGLLEAKILVAQTPQEAVHDADIVATCTAATQPLIKIGDFKSGAHINALGASRPGYSEIELQDRPGLKIYLDWYENCSLEADEVFAPLKRGTLSKSHIVGDLGDVLLKKIEGRSRPDEITFFKSVGLGVEDLYAADLAYQTALKKNCGTFISFAEEAKL